MAEVKHCNILYRLYEVLQYIVQLFSTMVLVRNL